MPNDIPSERDDDGVSERSVRALYDEIIVGWNARDGEAFATAFAEDAEVIGFDGSQMNGRAEIAATLGRIFADHPTPPYLAKVRGVRLLSPQVALLRAIVGMVLPGESDIAPQLNATQTLVAVAHGEQWQAVLLQTTPAQFHGRPDLAEAFTAELRELIVGR